MAPASGTEQRTQVGQPPPRIRCGVAPDAATRLTGAARVDDEGDASEEFPRATGHAQESNRRQQQYLPPHPSRMPVSRAPGRAHCGSSARCAGLVVGVDDLRSAPAIATGTVYISRVDGTLTAARVPPLHRRSIVSTRTPNIDVEIWRVVAIERQSGHDACVLGTLLVLAGPKGVGKSWVAAIAERDFGVHYVDADLLILELLEKGSSPDPEDGWLNPVRGAVLDALARYPVVSAEITGAWDSDYKLIRDVRDAGHRATCIWICAPLEETLARLQARATRKVPISETEVRSTYQQAVDRARGEHWDATIETSGAERPDEVKAVIGRLLEGSA